MISKYFTVEVKPFMTMLSAGQHAAFADGDVLFDWTAFSLPTGASRLIGAHVEIRPKGNANVDPNIFPLELVLAKSKNFIAPTTLGALNTAAAAPGVIGGQTDTFFGHLPIIAANFADTDSLALASAAAPDGMVLQPEHNLTNGIGTDKMYIGGIAGGDIDLTSLTRINAGDLDGPIYTVNGTDPRLHFAIGDTLYATASGSAVQLISGTVEALTETRITMTEAGVALSNTDFIYNANPIRVVLTFER